MTLVTPNTAPRIAPAEHPAQKGARARAEQHGADGHRDEQKGDRQPAGTQIPKRGKGHHKDDGGEHAHKGKLAHVEARLYSG